MEDIQRSSCDDTEDQMQHFFSRKSSAVSGREKNPPGSSSICAHGLHGQVCTYRLNLRDFDYHGLL